MTAELILRVPSIPVIAVRSGTLETAFERLTDFQKTWAQELNFTAKCGEVLSLPDDRGELDIVLFGLGNAKERERGRLFFGKLPKSLPAGNYHLVLDDDEDEELAALAWLLSSYKFDLQQDHSPANNYPKLVRPESVDAERINVIAQSSHMAMDLINRPANDLTPIALEEKIQQLASENGADCESVVGSRLQVRNFPLIYTVGQASVFQPRLVELNWGNASDPKLTIVGKGVCFDTGGLNLKPGSSMALMKKDMGGAANALALASMIMQLRLPVKLQVLIPIVENSVSSSSMRPGDIYTARNGLSVEINNTDAEGRLILADSLAYAAEQKPDLIISMATLTGAARVALGPDLVPFYSTDDDLSDALCESAKRVQDPLWPMPFWVPYETMIEPEFADLDNAPSGGMAGSVTAALFLKRFVSNSPYLHLDLYGWTPNELPGRPKGGAVQGARAIFDYLENKYATK